MGDGWLLSQGAGLEVKQLDLNPPCHKAGPALTHRAHRNPPGTGYHLLREETEPGAALWPGGRQDVILQARCPGTLAWLRRCPGIGEHSVHTPPRPPGCSARAPR